MIELMAALGLLLTVSGIIMGALVQTTRVQGTVSNRTEMHAGIRSATELLQQEIGQAGRISLPGLVTLTSAVTGGSSNSPAVSSTCSACAEATSGMFVGEQLVVDPSSPSVEETVTVTAMASTNFTATFLNSHSVGVAVVPLGAFAGGIVPTTTTNGSTGSVLKLFGDINGDGNMVYVEYTCELPARLAPRPFMPPMLLSS